MFGLHIYDLLTLCTYLIGITIIGFVASRGVKGTLDYFMGGGKFGQADHHYLNVGRIIGVLMVVAGIVVTEIFGSVVELWRFVPISAMATASTVSRTTVVTRSLTISAFTYKGSFAGPPSSPVTSTFAAPAQSCPD